MTTPRFEKISWLRFAKDSAKLAKKIGNTYLTRIVAISRGGLVVARILSDLLNLPISHITIASYQDLKQMKEPIITEGTTNFFTNDHILLLDEVTDTGKTFIRALSYLKNFSTSKVYTASIYTKPHTRFIPDFYVCSIDAWIIFPYDIRETYKAFVKTLGSHEKAILKMHSLGFATWEIKTISTKS